ncbi:hypothetical protein [Bradyrhizobium sp. MOS003]|uniref:hypothetical protein n=1 Tax=Bradyrhizobium sp. MOS003 TaxID=2133946 RepID=UPI0011BFD773|nr:hypothetical protein [Bradyrhizobium sp. MOS003]
MNDDADMSDLKQVRTTGDYSPGVVMGNYVVNSVLTPTSVQLSEAFQLRIEFTPSDKGYFTELGGRPVFVNGCKFELNIGNAGLSDLVLGAFRLSVSWEDIAPIVMRDKERRYGGLFLPHQLFVDLYRDAAPGWWLISNGNKHDSPRGILDARNDLLESGGGPRLRFRLKPGEIEVIEGGIIPKQDGLFRVRFVFGVSSPTDKLSKQTKEVLIASADSINGD